MSNFTSPILLLIYYNVASALITHSSESPTKRVSTNFVASNALSEELESAGSRLIQYLIHYLHAPTIILLVLPHLLIRFSYDFRTFFSASP